MTRTKGHVEGYDVFEAQRIFNTFAKMVSDRGATDQIVHQIGEMMISDWGIGKKTEAVTGYRIPSENRCKLFGPNGEFHDVQIVDVQSEDGTFEPNAINDVIDNVEDDPRAIASSSEHDLATRGNALVEWVAIENDEALEYVLSELSRISQGDPCEWIASLVFAAEDATFPDDRISEVLESLGKSIVVLRNSDDTLSEQAVFAAIRKYSALVPARDAQRLLDFWPTSNAVDTRLSVLTGLLSIFEVEQPTEVLSLDLLRDRILSFVEKFTDIDVFAGSRIPAIAELAITLSIALHDGRLPETLRQRSAMLPKWFLSVLHRQFDSLAQNWKEMSREEGLRMIQDVKDVIATK